MPASLLLPMGRNGPAFLAFDNFKVYTEWNQSLVYATTAAYYATRLAGAPPYNKGRADVPAYGLQDMRSLQEMLMRHGYEVGKLDGIIGAATRDAIRQAQIKFGLPCRLLSLRRTDPAVARRLTPSAIGLAGSVKTPARAAISAHGFRRPFEPRSHTALLDGLLRRNHVRESLVLLVAYDHRLSGDLAT